MRRSVLRAARSGFTLLEISMAVMIGLLMLGLAMPSMSGLFAEQRLRDRMGDFEAVVRQAAALAKESRQEVRVRWFKEGIGMSVGDANDPNEVPALVFEFRKDEVVELRRVAARMDKPSAEWSFWPSGIREPVDVAYAGAGGIWELRFGALVPDPDVITMRPK